MNGKSNDFTVTFKYQNKEDLDNQLEEMIDEIVGEASTRDGYIEFDLIDPRTGSEYQFELEYGE